MCYSDDFKLPKYLDTYLTKRPNTPTSINNGFEINQYCVSPITPLVRIATL